MELTQKEKQRYGEVVKQNQQRKKNEVINENDEFDVPGMRTHGSVSVEEEKPDEENRKKMENVANKLDRLAQNKYEEKGEKGTPNKKRMETKSVRKLITFML